MAGGERTERYRGYTLAQCDWYYVAKLDGVVRFTATTVEGLRYMVDMRKGR